MNEKNKEKLKDIRLAKRSQDLVLWMNLRMYLDEHECFSNQI